MLHEEDACDLDLIDECLSLAGARAVARGRPFQPGDMVVHAHDVEAIGIVTATDRLGHVLVMWSAAPALIARRVADSRRDLRDDIDRQILNDLLVTEVAE